MTKMFITIAGVVIVMNIMYLLLPDGKLLKYNKFIAGLIVMCTVVAGLFQVDFTATEILNFTDGEISVNENMEEVAAKQVKTLTEEKIRSHLGGEDIISVNCEIENGALKKVILEVKNKLNAEKIKISVAEICDIKTESVVIE